MKEEYGRDALEDLYWEVVGSPPRWIVPVPDNLSLEQPSPLAIVPSLLGYGTVAPPLARDPNARLA